MASDLFTPLGVKKIASINTAAQTIAGGAQPVETEKRVINLSDLFTPLGVKKGEWRALALALARRWLQLGAVVHDKPRRGAPRKHGALTQLIEITKEREKVNQAKALRILAQDNLGKRASEKKIKAEIERLGRALRREKRRGHN
jgi:hypothetical protein